MTQTALHAEKHCRTSHFREVIPTKKPVLALGRGRMLQTYLALSPRA